MDASHRILMVACLAAGLLSQRSDAFKYTSSGAGGGGDYYSGQTTKQKAPVILMHKQALSQDGAFNYAFAGDNGIQQGETISPDGTRTGAYSYVDPNGETVSVKYSAGKDGFKILQGDHVPRAVAGLHGAASAASPAKYPSPSAAPPFGYGRAASDELEDEFPFAVGASSGSGGGGAVVGSFSHHRAKINPAAAAAALYRVHEESSAEHFPAQFVPVPYGGARSPHSRSQDASDEYEGGPHSFGSGYAFEFGSGS